MIHPTRFSLILVPAYLACSTAAWAAGESAPVGVGQTSTPTAAAPVEVPASAAAIPATEPTAPTAPDASTGQTPAPAVQNTANAEWPENKLSPEPTVKESPAKPKIHDGPETLLGSEYQVGGFGGIGVMYTRFAGKDTAAICGEGALLLNHVLSIGGGGCGMARAPRTINFDAGADPSYRTTFGYGGGIIRYHFYSYKYLSLAASALVGAGAITSGRWNDKTDEYEDPHHNPDLVFVFEPQISGYLTITRWLRLGATAGYRFVSGVDTNGLEVSDLAAPSLGGQIQMGWF
ncbi:MAG TPA: hypothetical protein VKP30_00050 [Polyangiaceae bacterium]|nr:hypothetical protein [Polyangiaceae bacterium]